MDGENALRGLCSGRGSSPSARAKFAQPVGLCGAVSALVVDLHGPSTPTRCRRCAGDSKLPVPPPVAAHAALPARRGPCFGLVLQGGVLPGPPSRSEYGHGASVGWD